MRTHLSLALQETLGTRGMPALLLNTYGVFSVEWQGSEVERGIVFCYGFDALQCLHLVLRLQGS